MSQLRTRITAIAVATALGFSSLSLGAPQATADDCTAASHVSLFTYNDFHGRIANAAALFTPVEKARAEQGEDNVALLSVGDDIGGSTFESMADDDNPTLEVLAAADLSAYTAGNHEFDKGWADLVGRVHATLPEVDLLGANVYTKGTTQVAAPLKAYTTFKLGELDIAVVGAVTGDLPSLVSPAGIADLTIGDPVEAVNNTVAQLPPDIDLVIASIHEGAPSGSGAGDDQAAASPSFARMWTDIDPRVSVVLNGHTHQTYSWTNAKGQLFTQAGSYAAAMNELQVGVTADGAVCGITNTTTQVNPDAVDTSLPRIQKITEIVAAAITKADQIGATVIGNATEAISTPTGNADVRNVESPMSNMVAQMFYDVLNNGDSEFIGVQNPGGTRDSFDQGDITYKEAALTLPFANSLFTTQLSGAQFKTVLEQQWQRNSQGEVPSRPFLRLGLSSNVTYAYDEARPEGDRITGIYINGSPINPAKLYTVGSGSFLIAGGDNFHELANGVNTKDTGRADLEAWTAWVKTKGTLSPSYVKRGVSVAVAPTELARGGSAGVFSFDVTADAQAPEGLDFLLGSATGTDPKDPNKVSPGLPNTHVEAYLGDLMVGTGTVTDGRSRVAVTMPADCSVATGRKLLTFRIAPSDTVVRIPVTITGDDAICSPQPAPTSSPTNSPSPQPRPKPGPPKTGH
ncbi:MAG: 5'-nucleotidase C-terminal domain-containing protein [Propionibacteriaceae bacterium]|nr:5'-nucleotidase C-terminal domain-containing protein [Propionibacteriaceae bacterium]